MIKHFLSLSFTIFLCAPLLTEQQEHCSDDSGGGLCPEGNTCCLRLDGLTGCIASDMGKSFAECCKDRQTGCGVGYKCRADGICINVAGKKDPLVQTMPRYHLCHTNDIDTVHGIPVKDEKSDRVAELAYYSNHGPINQALPLDLEMALIFIHGSERNADDYFCSGTAMIDLQSQYPSDKVLLIAPRFYGEHDVRPRHNLLYWEDEGSGHWRYGANAVGPATISSYAALDAMVESIWNLLPGLRRVVVAGHSAGGQFSQRWALLTKHWNNERMHAVVANPSSYAYLTPLRLLDGGWKLPSSDYDCPNYNQWEWGLDDGGAINVPYRNNALKNSSAVIVDRFRDRNVVYLAGGVDRCNVSGHDTTGWCYSHGLETECMDQVQGLNRLERSQNYYKSLQMLGFNKNNHKWHLVPGVGHDHSLMFQSEIGLQAVFEAFQAKDESQPMDW